jgi:hypothetical protein
MSSTEVHAERAGIDLEQMGEFATGVAASSCGVSSVQLANRHPGICSWHIAVSVGGAYENFYGQGEGLQS